MPHLKANPSGALSSVVPTGDCQRIFPALRSTATNAPHGGLLHGIPRGDIATTRVIAKGAPSCGPNSTPGGGLKPSASAPGINFTIINARLGVGVRIWLTGSNAAPPQFTPPPVIGKISVPFVEGGV